MPFRRAPGTRDIETAKDKTTKRKTGSHNASNADKTCAGKARTEQDHTAVR